MDFERQNPPFQPSLDIFTLYIPETKRGKIHQNLTHSQESRMEDGERREMRARISTHFQITRDRERLGKLPKFPLPDTRPRKLSYNLGTWGRECRIQNSPHRELPHAVMASSGKRQFHVLLLHTRELECGKQNPSLRIVVGICPKSVGLSRRLLHEGWRIVGYAGRSM